VGVDVRRNETGSLGAKIGEVTTEELIT